MHFNWSNYSDYMVNVATNVTPGWVCKKLMDKSEISLCFSWWCLPCTPYARWKMWICASRRLSLHTKNFPTQARRSEQLLFDIMDFWIQLLMTLMLILFVLHYPDFQACVDQRRPIRFHHRLLQPGVYAEVEDEHPAVRFSSGNAL